MLCLCATFSSGYKLITADKIKKWIKRNRNDSMNCFYSSSGHPANKPYADSMPVHRLRRRSGTQSALPMPIRRAY